MCLCKIRSLHLTIFSAMFLIVSPPLLPPLRRQLYCSCTIYIYWIVVSGLTALVSEGIIHMTKRLKWWCFYVHISISQVNIKPISISNLTSRKKNCNPIEKGHSSAHDHVTCFLCIIIPHSHNNKISRFCSIFSQWWSNISS